MYSTTHCHPQDAQIWHILTRNCTISLQIYLYMKLAIPGLILWFGFSVTYRVKLGKYKQQPNTNNTHTHPFNGPFLWDYLGEPVPER